MSKEEPTDSLIEHLRRFGIKESKARELVRNYREVVEEQIAALPYRGIGPGRKNTAGWVIAAIEKNYELPQAYHEAKVRAEEVARGHEKRNAIIACTLCDSAGFRTIKVEGERSSPLKKCSHDPEVESKYDGA
jgi:hypothetical protein